MSRDLQRELKNIKTQEKQCNVKIKQLIASLNEAYADSVAISIEKEEIINLLMKEKDSE